MTTRNAATIISCIVAISTILATTTPLPSLIHDCESFAKQYNVPGATINPYTNLTGQSVGDTTRTTLMNPKQLLSILKFILFSLGKDVQSKWNEVKTLVPQRDNTLQDELKKQENNEALRRQFAEKSNQVNGTNFSLLNLCHWAFRYYFYWHFPYSISL